MRRLKAREILQWSEEELWACPEGPMILEFDDGELKLENSIKVTVRGKECEVRYNPMGATRISSYYWNIQREFPDAPLLKIHHIGHRIYDSSVHGDLNTRVYFDTLDRYRELGKPVDTERMMWLLMKTASELYNMYCSRLNEYHLGISVLDFHEIEYNKTVRSLNQGLIDKKKVTSRDIDETHKGVMEVLSDPSSFENNGVSNAIIRSLVSPGQVLQCVSARGFVEDIDSNIFREPIRTGFYRGLYKLSDYAKESRSASKASFFQSRWMGDSEYLNRSIQLSTSIISRHHPGDCGNTRTLAFTVSDANDLKSVTGKWYKLRPNDEKWSVVRKDDTFLIGKIIRLRSLHGCLHKDPAGVCDACLGDIADSMVEGTNIGWVASADVLGRGGQLLLSVKHNDGSVSARVFKLDPFVQRYLQGTDDPCQMKLNPRIKDEKPKMVILRKQAEALNDILYAEDAWELTPSRVTSLEKVLFETVDATGPVSAQVEVSGFGRPSSLTHEAMDYIMKHGWEVNDKNNYVIDLKDWDYDKPFFVLPLKHYSMADQIAETRRAIKGSKEPLKGNPYRILDFNTPEKATNFLHDLCSTKMPGTQYVYLEIIVASLMAKDPDNGDYSLPKPFYKGTIVPHRDAMFHRGLAPMMAFEQHHVFFMDPEVYLDTDRPESPMDMLLMHPLAGQFPPVKPPVR